MGYGRRSSGSGYGQNHGSFSHRKMKVTCRDCKRTFEIDPDKDLKGQIPMADLHTLNPNGRKYKLREFALRGGYLQ